MQTKQHIYLVHGYTSNANANWFPDLKEKLSADHTEVHIFNMPDSAHPKEKQWLDFLKNEIDEIKPGSIFIGHSLGCVAILNFLEDRDLQQVASLYLISGFVEETPIDKLAEFVCRKIDYSKFINAVNTRVVIAAKDDDIVPYSYTEILAQKLQAEFILLDEGGHFMDRDGFTRFPFLINKIKQELSAPDQKF